MESRDRSTHNSAVPLTPTPTPPRVTTSVRGVMARLFSTSLPLSSAPLVSRRDNLLYRPVVAVTCGDAATPSTHSFSDGPFVRCLLFLSFRYPPPLTLSKPIRLCGWI